MHSSDGCIWGWVRSWAINLWSGAGHHTRSLSRSFPGKQLCESLEWWGNAPSTLLPQRELPVPTPEPLPAPTSDLLLGEFWDDGNGEALQSRHQHFPHLPCQRGTEPITLHGAISRPPDLHTSDTTFLEELAKSRGTMCRHVISTLFKITASQPSNTYLPHHSPATS